MILWRLSRYTELQGIGGLHASGRWHEKGHPIVYAAAERLSPDSPVLANEHESRRFGTAWLTEKRSAVLLVPSVIIPVETNILINPGHPDAAGVSMIEATESVFDDRLFVRLL